MARDTAVEKKEKKPKKRKIRGFFKDFKSELKKVVWPTKKQVVNNTIVVCIAITIVGIFLFGLDTLLGFLVSLVLQKS